MDGSTFDHFARLVAFGGTRRNLLGVLIGLPVLGLLGLADGPEAEASRRHQRHPQHDRRREDRHVEAQKRKKKKGKKKKRSCVSQAQATTCAGRCATITDNCGKAVDCGPCACTPTCSECQTCDAATGQCGPAANGTSCTGAMCCNGACCPTSTPVCKNEICQLCTAHSECPANHLCLADGACLACDVTCPSGSSPSECGIALQAAIDAGGTRYVCPGTYRGQTTDALGFLVAGTVRLVGAGDGDNPSSNTILDQDADDCRVLTNDGGHLELSQVRVTGGRFSSRAIPGGGIYNFSGEITMTDCTVNANAALAQGGGLANGNGSTIATMTLVGSTISDNKAGNGAGIYNLGTLILDDCDVVDNETLTGSGGGIRSLGGEVTLRNGTTLRSNSSVGNGGGLFCENATSVIIDDSSITDNEAALDAGGIYVFKTPLTLRNGSTVSENTARSGAGIYLQVSGVPAEMTIDHSSVTDNTATTDAGGILVDIRAGGTVTISDSLVQGNDAGNFGGGIYNLISGAVVTLAGTTSVIDNSPGNCTGDGDYVGSTGRCAP